MNDQAMKTFLLSLLLVPAFSAFASPKQSAPKVKTPAPTTSPALIAPPIPSPPAQAAPPVQPIQPAPPPAIPSPIAPGLVPAPPPPAPPPPSSSPSDEDGLLPAPKLDHFAALWEKSLFTSHELPAPEAEAPAGPIFTESLTLMGMYEINNQVRAVLQDKTTSLMTEAGIGSDNEEGIRIVQINPGPSQEKTRIQLKKGNQTGWVTFSDAPAAPVQQMNAGGANQPGGAKPTFVQPNQAPAAPMQVPVSPPQAPQPSSGFKPPPASGGAPMPPGI